jgi:hypothetical protein
LLILIIISVIALVNTLKKILYSSKNLKVFWISLNVSLNESFLIKFLITKAFSHLTYTPFHIFFFLYGIKNNLYGTFYMALFGPSKKCQKGRQRGDCTPRSAPPFAIPPGTPNVLRGVYLLD